MTIIPKFRTKYGEAVGIELFFEFPDISNNEKTYLDADVAAATGSCTANGTNFSVGQYVVIGRPGQEKTEIIRIHAATAPTTSTITFATNTVYAHSRGEPITFIQFNQIVPSRSTDSGVTYGALSAIDIRPDSLQTYLQRASDASTDYYKFRFYNSADATYSAYSDESVATGFASNTVGAIKNRALMDLGETKNAQITDNFLNESLWEARRELDQDPRVGRWNFRTKFNTDIGNVIPGTWKLAVPTDLRHQNTGQSVLSLRIGRDNTPLEYQDQTEFNNNYLNIAHTTLNGAVTTGDPTITLTSSGDFDESGNIEVAAADVTGSVDTITYTANNESTNVISGVTGIQAAGHATGTDVWQGISFGLPGAYTVQDGYFYFDLPFDDDYAGENIWCDYYTTMPAYNSDSDVLDEPEYDLFVSYLKWKIKYNKSNGTLKPSDDGDYMEWVKRKNDLVVKQLLGQEIAFVPD